MTDKDIYPDISEERDKFWERNHRESMGTAVDDVLIFSNGVQLYITGWKSVGCHLYEVRSWNSNGSEKGVIIASYGTTFAHLKQRPMSIGIDMFSKIHKICEEVIGIFASFGNELSYGFNYRAPKKAEL